MTLAMLMLLVPPYDWDCARLSEYVPPCGCQIYGGPLVTHLGVPAGFTVTANHADAWHQWVRQHCGGDFNNDGVIDASDLLMLLGAWGPCDGCAMDINEDGTVDVSDLLLLLEAWE